MTKKSRALQAPPVVSADLAFQSFEDPDAAEAIAKDCIKLFEASAGTFEEIRNQAWYKRIWTTLTGGNTRRLALGCSTLAQAQQMLAEVIQIHARTSERSSVLLSAVAHGLRHLHGRQNQIVASIVHLADRLELVEEELRTHRDMLAGNSKSKKAELARIDGARAQIAREKAEREEAVVKARAALSQVGPKWIDYVSEGLSAASILAPVGEIYQRYDAAKTDSILDIVKAFDAEKIVKAVNKELKEGSEAFSEVMDRFEEWHPLPPSLHRRMADVWKLVVDDDGGWEDALEGLLNAGTAFVEAEPSSSWEFVKNAGGGALAGFFLGPLGIPLAMAAGAMSDKSAHKKLEQAANAWDSAVEGVKRATEHWQEKASAHLKDYLQDVVEELDLLMADVPTPELMGVVEAMNELMEDSTEEASEEEEVTSGD